MEESPTEVAAHPRQVRLVAAAAFAALLLIMTYAIDRSRAFIFSPGPDPAMVVASVRIEYFWRLILCAWLAPVWFAAAYWLAGGREFRALRLASRLTIPVALVAAALSTLFP